MKYLEELEYLKVNLPEDIARLKAIGNFDEERRLIEMRLQKDIPKALKKRLVLEKAIIGALPGEYTYSFDEALKLMQEKVSGFTKDELLKLKDGGFADWIFVNGEVRFQDSFCGNIIKTCPEVEKRLFDHGRAPDQEKRDRLLDDAIEEIEKEGELAYYIRVKASLKINEKAEEAGKNVQVHLPLPTACRQNSNIKILSLSHKECEISPESFPQRTVCFVKQLEKGEIFSAEYSYESRVRFINPNPAAASEIQPDFDMQELAPHIVFTPYIKELTKEIVGDETNPLIKARKIYDFITEKVTYSYVREYLTIENIPEYAALNLKGDCGVQALLFITLCRCAKIPARWLSGLYSTPYYIGCHDWAEFYVAPFGWLYADCSFGGGALRDGNRRRWNYYFGNLDPFRMTANTEYQHDFAPAKKFLRADPYDSQRGECEYEDRGLFYDDFHTWREVLEISKL